MFAMSYYGANRVVVNYNAMGPLRAALEAACRYLAYELGPQEIRVHAISPGPLKTRAASGLKDFELLLNEAAQKAPLGELVDIMDVGFACAYLATSLAKRITGGTVYVDGGANITVGSGQVWLYRRDLRWIFQRHGRLVRGFEQCGHRFRGQIEGIGVDPRLTQGRSRRNIDRARMAPAGFDQDAATREILDTGALPERRPRA